eukprot:jgi/Psemu1/195537/e_gw1.174.5.1
MASSTRASPTITKVPVVVVDPKIQSKKTTAKSSTGHEKTNYNSSTKSSHPKSSLHKTNSSARCEAQVEIVSRLVGWMIGKNGQRIRDLMEESGAKIWIDQEKFKGQETRNVYISGDRKSVEHAVTLVNDVVINAPPPQGSAHAMAAATAAMATMNISPKAFVPLLIGKRGWTIKHIQDDSGARVDIDQSVTPRQVRISGIKANVDKAVTLVRDVL